MKKIVLFLVIACTCFSFSASAQTTENAVEKFFGDYLEDERFTVVYISPKLFQMLGNLNIDAIEMDDEEAAAILDVAQDMRGLRILTCDECEEESYNIYKEAKSRINTSDYEILMTVKDNGGSNFEFWVIENEDGTIGELLMIGGGKDEDFFLLSFVGSLDLNKVSRLANTLENR